MAKEVSPGILALRKVVDDVHADAVAQAAHAAGHASVDTGDDIALIRADGELGDDFALSEHRAGGADADLARGLIAQLVEIFDVHFQLGP